MTAAGRVLMTDHPWPGTEIESELLTAAGLELVAAPAGASGEDLEALGADVVAVMTCWAPVRRALLLASPALRCVTRMGVGLDNIDLVTARELGLTVTNVPDYCVEEVSDHVLALVHAWARQIVWYVGDTRAGRWRPGQQRTRRVRELTVGVWGHGRIGARVADKFSALGCEVLVHSRGQSDGSAGTFVSLDELLARSDVVSLHVPYTSANHHLIDAATIAKMKPGAMLVNTARGGLVSNEAVLAGLASDQLDAVALDVLEGEPAVPADLAAHPRIYLTPHSAFISDTSVIELRERACVDVVRVMTGHAPHYPVQ